MFYIFWAYSIIQIWAISNKRTASILPLSCLRSHIQPSSSAHSVHGGVFQTTATVLHLWRFIVPESKCQPTLKESTDSDNTLFTGVVGVSGLCRCLCQQHILPHPVGSQTSVQGKTRLHKGADQAVAGKLSQLSMAFCCSLQSNG